MRGANVLVLMAVVTGSSASDWVPAGVSEGSIISVDRSSIKRANPGSRVRSAWFRVDYAAPQRFANVIGVRHVTVMQYTDCQARRVATQNIIFYDEHFGVLSQQESRALNYEEAVPDSVSDRCVIALCDKNL